MAAFEVLSELNCSKEVMSKISNEIVSLVSQVPWRRQREWFIKSFKIREK